MSFALAQYRSTRIETASPVQLVVDLYRGAISAMTQAQAFEAEGKPGERGRVLSKAHAIVSELQATLDRSHAPELCAELDRLYDFVLFRISEANLEADPTLLDPAIEVMSTLADAWAELARKQK